MDMLKVLLYKGLESFLHCINVDNKCSILHQFVSGSKTHKKTVFTIVYKKNIYHSGG